MEKENKNKLKVGDILYRELHSRYEPTKIKSYEIEKIGNKFIYVKGLGKKPVNIIDLEYKNKDYSQYNIQFYLSEQEILDKNELLELTSKVRKAFDWSSNTSKFTLNQLREVNKVLMLN
jgi:hypothetical protein